MNPPSESGQFRLFAAESAPPEPALSGHLILPDKQDPVGLSSFARQRSFDDLGTPLDEVTFCVLDIETTGGSHKSDLITELGAVKVRGGEILGKYSTMVNPGVAIPPRITVITGITDQLVMRAPAIDQVLPAFLEFIGGSIIVGHNVRFDMSFINSAVDIWGGPPLDNQRLDTLALARRLLQGETPRFGLGELAARLNLPHQPSHRALADAEATLDLLHYLIERASAWGVTGLDDLLSLPKLAGHPQHSKLALTAGLPRSPGVYCFLGPNETVLYVGKATNLRSRVRSYFSSDKRRNIPQLLKLTREIRYEPFENSLLAELREIALIRDHQPRFNKQGKRTPKPAFIKLTTAEDFPRLLVTTKKSSSGVYLGPLPSRRSALDAIEAIHQAIPIRRCSRRLKRGQLVPTDSECLSGQLGVAMCPCSGSVSEREYDRVVESVRRCLLGEAEFVLEPLEKKMLRLASEERFEEAASIRDSASAFVYALQRVRKLSMFSSVSRLVLETPEGTTIKIGPGGGVNGSGEPNVESVLCVASWFARHAHQLRLVELVGELTSPLPGLPRYA